MDILINIVFAAVAGILVYILNDVIKKYVVNKSDSEKVSVTTPSGQKVEIDAPLDDNKLLDGKLKSIIYNAEPISISKKNGINLLKDVILPSTLVFEKSLKKNDLKLIINKDIDKVSNINADTEALRQVFFNLMDNAIKYSSIGGTINVDGQETENSVDVTITGSSSAYLKPSEIEHIFEKGVRGASTLEKNKLGTGLGLWVAKNLVEAHDGDLTIQPNNNLVTTKITLPKESG